MEMAGDPGVLAQPKSTQKLQQQHPQAALGRCRMASWGVAPVHSLHPPSTMGWKEVPNLSTGTSNRPAFVYGISSLLGLLLGSTHPTSNTRCASQLPVLQPQFHLPLFPPLILPAQILHHYPGCGQAQSTVAEPVSLLHRGSVASLTPFSSYLH